MGLVAPEEWKPASQWEDHPDFTGDDWVREVSEGDTRLGYVDWVNGKIEDDFHDKKDS
jgi:hypothetical protein